MREDFIKYYKLFIDKFGIESQEMICIEEMSELTKELCKLSRYKGSDKEKEITDNIREELADVLNMAEQLSYYYGSEEIEKIREFKINRLLSKIDKK